MSSAVDFSRENRELQAILASGIFDRSPALAQLLSYVCAKYFEGTADRIKEYSLAIDVLGRPPDFDPKRDSIIRVQFHRLRERLAEYYANGGANDPVHIVIPQGQYAPRFVHRDDVQDSTGGLRLITGGAEPLPAEDLAVPEVAPALPVQLPPSPNLIYRTLLGEIAGCCFVAIGFSFQSA